MGETNLLTLFLIKKVLFYIKKIYEINSLWGPNSLMGKIHVLVPTFNSWGWRLIPSTEMENLLGPLPVANPIISSLIKKLKKKKICHVAS